MPGWLFRTPSWRNRRRRDCCRKKPESCRSLIACSYCLIAFPYFFCRVVDYAQIVVGVSKLAIVLDRQFEVLAGFVETRHLKFVDADFVVKLGIVGFFGDRGPVVVERVQIGFFGAQSVASLLQAPRPMQSAAGASARRTGGGLT